MQTQLPLHIHAFTKQIILHCNASTQHFCSFGGGSRLPINLHEINCAGNESRLIDCEYEVYTHFYCHHSQNVAIVCDGEYFLTINTLIRISVVYIVAINSTYTQYCKLNTRNSLILGTVFKLKILSSLTIPIKWWELLAVNLLHCMPFLIVTKYYFCL